MSSSSSNIDVDLIALPSPYHCRHCLRRFVLIPFMIKRRRRKNSREIVLVSCVAKKVQIYSKYMRCKRNQNTLYTQSDGMSVAKFKVETIEKEVAKFATARAPHCFRFSPEFVCERGCHFTFFSVCLSINFGLFSNLMIATIPSRFFRSFFAWILINLHTFSRWTDYITRRNEEKTPENWKRRQYVYVARKIKHQ